MPVLSFQCVYALVRRVPVGRVVTYGQLARALGVPQGARVVGWAMRRCPHGVPWHRVVNAEGGISLRRDPVALQRQRVLLEAEGVSFEGDGRIDLTRYGWDEI